MMRKLVQAIIFLVLIGPVNSVYADEGLDKFIEVLTSYKSLTADFVQLTMDSDSMTLNEIHGEMTVRRPHEFLWRSFPPQDQEVISNGETLWIYDKDLEQVTFEPARERVRLSPAVILSGERDTIDQQYDINLIGTSENKTQYRLIPRDSLQSVTQIDVFTSDNLIEEIRFEDSLGQTTLIQLSNHKINPRLKGNFFDFKPPKGVDVLDQSR